MCSAGGADRKSERDVDIVAGDRDHSPKSHWPGSRHSVQSHVLTSSSSVAMSLARAFPPALRELRILFSQTGNTSEGVRQARHNYLNKPICADSRPQAIRPVVVPYAEAAQPRSPHTHTGSPRNTRTRFCSVRFVVYLLLPRSIF